MAFIDFINAYDTVNRTILWVVLSKTGLQGIMFRMIRSMSDTVQAFVKSRSGLTDFFECCQVLKQGCGMTPILFFLFSNELANEIKSKS